MYDIYIPKKILCTYIIFFLKLCQNMSNSPWLGVIKNLIPLGDKPNFIKTFIEDGWIDKRLKPHVFYPWIVSYSPHDQPWDLSSILDLWTIF